MIVDSSALIALAMGEPDYRQCEEAMLQGRPLLMSAASFLEAAIVVDGKGDPVFTRRFDDLFGAFGIEVADVTAEQARIARLAFRDFGRGSGIGPGSTSATASAMRSPSTATSRCSSRATTWVTRVCAARSAEGRRAQARSGLDLK